MKRLYYVTDNLESVDSISKDLHQKGITDWNFHVLSKDEAGLYKRHINSALPWQQFDIVHTALQGALVGLVLGFVIGYLIDQLTGFGTASIVVMLLLGLFFGTWTGGFIGLAHENYKVRRYHDDIEAGKYLVMVDIKKDQVEMVNNIMRRQHPEAQKSGEDTTLINPLTNSPAT